MDQSLAVMFLLFGLSALENVIAICSLAINLQKWEMLASDFVDRVLTTGDICCYES